MKSAVKEYLDVYSEFLDLLEAEQDSSNPISGLEYELQTLEESKKSTDYNDVNVVTSCMEHYIQTESKKAEYEIAQNVDRDAEAFNHPTKQTLDNYNDVCVTLGREKALNLINNNNVDYSRPIDIKNAENNTWLKVMDSFDKFNFFFFRLGFLENRLSRVKRALIFSPVWLIIYLVIISNTHNGIVNFVITFFAILIIVCNIIAPILKRSAAESYINFNLAVCKAITNFKSFRDDMCQYRIFDYQNTVVSRWNQELDNIKRNGLSAANANDPNMIYPIVRADLEKEYNNYCEQINNRKNKISRLQDEGVVVSAKIEEFKPAIREKEEKIDDIQVEDDNNGVITPYVSLGFSSVEKNGVKNLISFKHDCKPVMIEYVKPSLDEEEFFRKGVARIVEQLMMGFLHENYYGIIKMTLVDFESLHFPESRTKGFMDVIHSREEVTKLLSELKETRDKVNSLGNGKISSINSEKTKNGEKPIKYHIVFFVGYDFDSMDRENIQLFVGGENFGFIPIMFIEKNVLDASFDESVADKEFDKIIHRTYNGENFYSYEGLMNNFIYEKVVTNQIDDVQDKLCVNSVLTPDEFFAMLRSGDELDTNEMIYVHAIALDENAYRELCKYRFVDEHIRFFVFDGEDIPKYIGEDKVFNL